MNVAQEIHRLIGSKESRRQHRRNKEFTETTKKQKFREVEGKCELCSQKLKFHTAQFHHILPLSVAFHFYKGKFSDEILKSIHNCQVLCEACHNNLHDNDSSAFYSTIAQNLLIILETWEPPVVKRKICRNKKKQRRKELNKAETNRRQELGLESIDLRNDSQQGTNGLKTI